jgi:hypothetical protein
MPPAGWRTPPGYCSTAATLPPSSGPNEHSGPVTNSSPGGPSPNSCWFPADAEAPASSCVKARAAPPGSWRLVTAMVARGAFGEPANTPSRPSTMASASAMIGYFQ